MERNNRTGTVRSVERAARLLEALFLASEGKHLGELSSQLGLHKTTVLRLLRTLVAAGLVQREPATDHYRFEPLRWMAIASHMRRAMERMDLVQRLLDDLSETIGETVGMVVPDQEHRRSLLAVSSQPTSVVRVDVDAIRVVPMHACAVGKAFLAHMSEEELERWVQGPLEAIGPNTITDPAALLEELRQVREQGYALSRQGTLAGVAGLGVAICDERGKPVGGLGMALVGETIPEDKVKAWVPLLRSVADQVSGLLYAGESGTEAISAVAAQEGAAGAAAGQGVPDSQAESQTV